MSDLASFVLDGQRIVAEVVPKIVAMDEQIISEWGDFEAPDAHLPLLRLLASPYEGRSGYLEEWRP